MRGSQVLLVDDDPEVRRLATDALEEAGFSVETASDGRTALERLLREDFDAVVLDVRMPPPDGIEVLTRLRRAGVSTPVLILSSLAAVRDRVEGLEAGADDYLPKPFALEELVARVRALVRRGAPEGEKVLRVGDLTLFPGERRVEREGVEILLTAREFAVLELLVRNAGRVVSRGIILDRVWESSYEGSSNVVDVYVRRVRDKVDRPFRRESIETVHGVGYRFRHI